MRPLLLVCLAACAPRSVAEPGVVTIEEKEQTASFLRNFNPLVEAGEIRWPARRAMYEPLMIFNAVTREYEPWLATGFAYSDDHLRLRFDLRRDVWWSDGAPFTAADVVFTFDLLARFPAVDGRGIRAYVSTVTAVDDHTVEFGFARVFVPGFYHLVQQPIVPAHVWAAVADPVTFTNPDPVGTGPFTEVTRFETQSYRIDRNPYTWHDSGVEAIQFQALPTNDQANLALIHGETDWAGSFVPAIDRIFVGRDPAHHRYWFPAVDGAVMLYPATGKPPFDDARVRKALSLAIDRAKVVEIGMYGYVRPTDDHAWEAYDPAAAAALLDEAGLPGGDGGVRFAATIDVPSGFSDWIRGAQVIVRNLRAIGVAAELRTHDFNAWFEKVQQGDFALAMGWVEPYPTRYGFHRAMMSSQTWRPPGEPAAENWHRFALPRADELLAVLEQTTDPAEETTALAELDALFDAHAPAIPLFPGPLWGECNTSRFTGFPGADDPYAPLSPNLEPGALLVLTRLEPR